MPANKKAIAGRFDRLRTGTPRSYNFIFNSEYCHLSARQRGNAPKRCAWCCLSHGYTNLKYRPIPLVLGLFNRYRIFGTALAE